MKLELDRQLNEKKVRKEDEHVEERAFVSLQEK